ncbi:MAG: SPOR domain-containing protein [Desulfuromonadales bacterium]|nr:SPOR domain-containing protein [Desulfuromonadales bacterium]
MKDQNDLSVAENSFPDRGGEPDGFPGGEIREPLQPIEGEPRKSSSTRILLLLLLLVVAGAGAFFYLGGTQPEAEVAVPVPAIKQPIAMPAPVADPAETVIVEAVISPPPAAAVAPAATAAAAASASPAPGLTLVGDAGKYRVDAGSFLLDANRRQAEGAIRKLGFQPEAVTIKRTVEMVRLRVGSYPPAEAAVKLQQVAALSPGAFSLAKGGEVTVYAGSYADLDKARAQADRLFLNGLELQEEVARVPMNLVRVTFGDFPDRKAALAAADRATSAGLQAVVVNR